MGKYTFTWEHPANAVYVTGTFDDWRKTVKLEKHDGIFQKTVELPKKHTQYKFVVDGNWCTNDTARKEDDGNGIVNNVLEPSDIVDEPVHTLSSAAPESTTTSLAGAVPKEEKTKSQEAVIPGAFPMTPAAETPGSEPQTFNINPIPATAGLGNPIKLAPGEPVPHSSTLTHNTVQSTVKHHSEPEATTFGIAPIPASAGAGNPIHLAPGEKVPDPSTFNSNTIHSTARTDPTSYAKSDAPPHLELALTPQAERDAKGGMFSLPPIMGNMIPESSLPMGVDAKVEKDTGVTIQSAAPTSSTAALAGLVPKEPGGVPEAVTESRKEAGFAPEAITNSEAVQEKKEVEQELMAKVPEVPAAADNSYLSNISANAGKAAATAAAGITAGAGLFTAAIYNAKDKAAEAVGPTGTATDAIYNAKDKAAAAVGLNGSATDAIYNAKDKAAATVGLNGSATTSDVPALVSQSQRDAHASPEAATNPEAVNEKRQVEQELLREIPKSTAMGESAPPIAIPAIVAESQKAAHASPEAATNPEAVNEKRQVEQELLSEIPKTTATGEPAPPIAIPAIVAESQKAAHTGPEASANIEAVAEKKAMESELLKEIPKTNEAGEPAPMITASTSSIAPGSKMVEPAPNVPDVVAESYEKAHARPEAAASIEVVGEKKAIEAELLQEIEKVNATGEPAPTAAATTSTNAAGLSEEALVDSKPLKSSSEPDGLNAPASTPAQPQTSKPIDSNTNVAFATPPPTTTEQTKPTVTTGAESSTTAAKSTAEVDAPVTPMKDSRNDSDVSPKGTPGTQSIASGTDDKKRKRRSIFGKIKDKLSKH